MRHHRPVPPVVKVEPITTARALRGPFDYLRPDGVGIGSVLVVPFGHRDVVGVVVDVADGSQVADERLVAQLEEHFRDDLENSKEFDAATWGQRPLRKRTAEAAISVVRDQF